MERLALSQRIEAPPRAAVPVSDSLSWRAATRGDLDGIAALTRAADIVDHPNYTVPREEIENDLGASWVDLPQDSLVATTEDGRYVASGLVMLSPSRETLVRSLLIGVVHPDFRGRGIGRQLLAWEQDRALQQLASAWEALPGEIAIFVAERAESQVRLALRSGFEISRYYLELTRDLSGEMAAPLAEPREIPGISFGSFDPATQSETVRQAKNDAFRDHFGSQPTTAEAWQQHVQAQIARPDLSVIATAENGDIAGFVLCDVNPEDWPGQGFSSSYIELVGVPRAYRGRGIAAACLARSLRLIADAGLDRAVLDVDSENPSGALGLYQRVGFVAGSRTLQLTKTF